jgi:hypothetical protein
MASSRYLHSLSLTKHHAMKAYWGIGGIAPRILDLGTRRRWVIASSPGRFTPSERAPGSPLHRRLGGPQSRSGRGGEEKNSQLPPGLESPIIRPAGQRHTTELTRLLYVAFYY